MLFRSLLPPNLDRAQIRLTLSDRQAYVSVTSGNIGDLVQNVVSIGTSFSHHALIIHLLAESATGVVASKQHYFRSVFR